MKLEELRIQLHFDEVLYVKNPYFYIRDYEDKAVVVLIKKEIDSELSFSNLEKICFECPDMEQHKDLVKMVLFNVNKDDKIMNYSIAASKYKVLRSDIVQYEQFVNSKIEIETEVE